MDPITQQGVTSASGRQANLVQSASKEELTSLIRALSALNGELDTEIRNYSWSARWNRWLFTWSRIATAFLAVIAPALVTYQLQDKYWSIPAILITGLAGAAAALQTSFRWGDSYARTMQTKLALDELHASSVQLCRELTEHQTNDTQLSTDRDPEKQYKWLISEKRRILKEAVLAEIALVVQDQASLSRSKTSENQGASSNPGADKSEQKPYTQR